MAASAYTLVYGGQAGPRNSFWFLYHTNTTASVQVADFLVADAVKFNPGDWVFAQKVGTLATAALGTQTVSGASVHLVASATASAVDLTNALSAAFSDTN